MPIPSRVAQHPLMPALSTFEQLLNQTSPTFGNQQPEIMERARLTAQFLRDRLADPTVALIADNTLTNMHSWIQACVNELQAANSQNNPGAIANGSAFYSNLDAISQNLAQMPISQPIDKLNTLVEEGNRRLEAMQNVQLQQEGAWRTARDEQARLLEDARSEKEEGLRRLQEQEAAAGKLLAALGAQGTSAGYRGTAEAEKKQADFWRWVTLAGGLVTAALAVALLLSIHEQGLDAIASRLGVTLPAVLLTVYAGKQSAGHREQERRAKRLELSFGSVDAYLADLDAGSRSDLKKLLSSDLFKSSGAGVSATTVDDYPTSADLVGLLSEAIKRMR